ncbi:MAG: winged helix-turn-helix transcriptional regulator [Candidatus Omnitrophica bacterium]|nr:winged helix-turn-helix transcriptional regulator [Candidatus Omnitrophota bacterium]MBU1996615.1 winged helix-turn-helix transcriptional regulator [Candidatus Omnitrophota bacterium]
MSKEFLDEREFELINIIGPKLGLNQRDISKHMNISLGMINMLIRRLIAKGFIRIKQLNKRKVEYILTPKGLAEKMKKSVKYTLKTINSIGLIKKCFKEVLSGLVNKGERTFFLLGESDFAILVEMVLKELCPEEYLIKHIDAIPNEKLEGTLLICREIKTSEDNVNKENSINLVFELAKDDNIVNEIIK